MKWFTILVFMVLAFGCSMPVANPAILIPTLFLTSTPKAIEVGSTGLGAMVPALIGFETTIDYTVGSDSKIKTKSNEFEIEITESEETVTYEAFIYGQEDSKFKLKHFKNKSEDNFEYNQHLVASCGPTVGIYDLSLNGTITDDGYTATGTIKPTDSNGNLLGTFSLTSGANSYGFITKTEAGVTPDWNYWLVNGTWDDGAEAPEEFQDILDSWNL